MNRPSSHSETVAAALGLRSTKVETAFEVRVGRRMMADREASIFLSFFVCFISFFFRSHVVTL